MAKALLLEPAAVAAALTRRIRANLREWFAGGGAWPLEIPLGLPNEAEAGGRIDALRRWVEAWGAWQGPAEVEWTTRRFRTLGAQRLPERLRIASAEAVADLIGEGARWRTASARRALLLECWPVLDETLPRHFELLADTADDEIARMVAMLAWLLENPASGLYLRQLPVEGVDTKWLAARTGVMGDLLRTLRGSGERDFHRLAGLAREPQLLRIKLLDEKLRAAVGGLGDITAPVEQIAQLTLPAERLLIVENLQTALACGDLPGTVLIFGGGYAVDLLGRIPWLAALPCRYWGDLDTHGLAILNRLRGYLPNAESLLMDEETLLRFRRLGVEEPDQHDAADLPLLTPAERRLYDDLRSHRFGARLRLEQERIPWGYAWERVAARSSPPPHPS